MAAAWLAIGGAAQAQRCGDFLMVYFRDRAGAPIKPSQLNDVHISAVYIVTGKGETVEIEPEVREVPSGIESFVLRVGCGLDEAMIEARYEGTWTILTVRHAPGDADNILVDGVPLTGGAWEVDLGWRPVRNAEWIDSRPTRLPSGVDSPRWIVHPSALRRVP